MRSQRGDAVPERIAFLKDERRNRGDVRGTANEWNHALAAMVLEASREHASENSFLTPRFARREFAVGREASHLSAGTGPAGRAIVSLTRAKNKVAAVIARILGRRRKLDVIDLRAIRSRDALRGQRLADLPGEFRQFLARSPGKDQTDVRQ